MPRLYTAAARQATPSSRTALLGVRGGAPDLVLVGAASRDRVIDDPRGWRLGGTATYASLAAARLGVRVGCLLGVDGEAAGAQELSELEAAGVLLRRVPLEHGPVFENIEVDGHRRQRWMSPSDPVPVEALPAGWERARAWLLGPVAGEIGVEWAAVPVPGSIVCVGWQGLLRRFLPEGRVEKIAPTASALLDRADIACASFDDLPADASIDGLRVVAPRASIVLTAGAQGGIALRQLQQARAFRYRAFPAEVVDATGAGDVFMAGFLAAWLLRGELLTPGALGLAAAAGACAVEGPGLEGVPSREQVLARMRGGVRR